MRAFILAVAGVFATTLGITACQPGVVHDDVGTVPVASVVVDLPVTSLVTGDTARARATAKDTTGAIVTNRSITWISSNTDVATVDANGLVTAVGLGDADISAVIEQAHGHARLHCDRPSVASVAVAPPSLALQTGGSGQLSAVARDANGNVLQGRTISWTSSNNAVVMINQWGFVTAMAAGNATITATSDGRVGQSTLTVTDPAPVPVASVDVSPSSNTLQVGATSQLVATPRDGSGAALSGRAVTWTSSNNGVATVSTSGWITAIAAGSATITATSEGKTGSSAVTVTAAPPTPVASVVVTPATASVQAGGTVQLSASTRDANGAVLNGRAVVWSSSNTTIANVSASGLVTSISAGAATITATSEGKNGTATITVTAAPPAPVASVTVSPATASIQAGGASQLSVTLRDAGGNVLTGRTITWTSSATGIAGVSASGLVTGVAAGSATITATSEGKTGTAAITVTAAPPAPVASVAVSPSTPSIQVGGTAQLSATTRDANGVVLTGRAIAWSSSNTGVATVSSSGLVTAVAAGSATITATSEGQTGTAAVTVTTPAPVPVATVVVTPSSSSIKVGGTVQLSASTRDANGAVLTGRSVAWSSSNTAVATVSGSGLVTGVAAGSATITATSEGKSGTSASTVTAVTTGSAPEPAPADVILVQDNFDKATQSALVANYATRGVQQLITNGRSGSAIRFPYSDASSDNLIETNFAATTDIYFRFWYRTSPGADPSCQGLNDSGIKWFMAWRGGSLPRYTFSATNADGVPYQGRPNAGLEFTSHDNSSTSEPAQFLSNINHNVRLATTNEGNWHKYTLHVVTGTGGYEQIWIDDIRVLDNSGMGYDHDPGGIAMIQFPGTMVRWFSGCDFYIDVDDLVVWHK